MTVSFCSAGPCASSHNWASMFPMRPSFVPFESGQLSSFSHDGDQSQTLAQCTNLSEGPGSRKNSVCPKTHRQHVSRGTSLRESSGFGVRVRTEFSPHSFKHSEVRLSQLEVCLFRVTRSSKYKRGKYI